MKLLGLTGGIGSGKSAAAACFREAGIPVIDADSIGHDLLVNDSRIRDAVLAAFGEAITTDGANISREKLADQIFGNEAARQQLNAILHPAIIGEVGRKCAALQETGHDAVIIEAALIGEAGKRDPWLTGIILVLAAEHTRMERLMQHRGFAEEDARQRIAAQTPPESKTNFADWIMDNNGDLDALRDQALKIAAAIRAEP